MTEPQINLPPRLLRAENGEPETNSLADLLEWFLTYDQHVGAIRHPFVEELFQWKQQEDEASGVTVYPFPHAEDRLAVGIFQALGENNNQFALHDWLTQLLEALEDAKKTNGQISEMYKLAGKTGVSPMEEAKMLPSKLERKIYLTTCWIETLCTAETRFLGYVYQELYKKPYHPQNL